MLALKAKQRTETGKKVRSFRKQGTIPAIMYGHKVTPQNLWVNVLEFRKVFAEAGENTVIELSLEGNGKMNVLVHDFQSDTLTGQISHVDFFQVRMDEKLETEIPLEFIGESKAIKELGGMLVKTTERVLVSCLPADLPKHFEVDIAVLQTFDDHIKVSDLVVPKKVQVLTDPEVVIALVERPRTDEEIAKLNEKVEEDVTKVQGVVKETPVAEEVKEK